MTRVARSRARRAAGQALVVFAMCSTVLFAFAGLGVDTAVRYLAAAAADRAAGAAATAGVTFMPQDFAGATAMALTTAGSNGFSNTDTAHGVTVSVAAYPPGCVVGGSPACAPNRLTVTVKENVPTTFMQILGVGQGTVTQTETAEYLRPIGLGQPTPQLGADDQSFGIYNPLASTAVNTQNAFMPDEEGWGISRNNGDAFTPNPTSQFPSSFSSPDLHTDSLIRGTDNVGTNVTQRGGYNYLIHVPRNTTISLQVFNPVFAPDNAYIPAGSAAQSLDEGHFMPLNAAGTDYDTSPQYYATMQYTLFGVNNVYDRNSDIQIARDVVKPIDAYKASSGSYSTICSPVATVTGMPSVFHTWYNVAAPPDASSSGLVAFTSSLAGGALPGGPSGANYRLRVETLDTTCGAAGTADPNLLGNPIASLKFYSVRAWDTTNNVVCGGCSVSAINDLSLTTELPSSPTTETVTLPLFKVAPEYAGRNIGVYIFDPGDLGQNPTLNLIPTTTSLTSTPQSVNKGGGITLTAQIRVPSGSFQCPEPSNTLGGATVAFFDGATKIGTANPCWYGPGTAELSVDTSTWTPGSHTIIAQFLGDSSYLGSTSSPVSVAVTSPTGGATCKLSISASQTTYQYQTNWFSVTGNITDANSGAWVYGQATLYNVATNPPTVMGTDTENGADGLNWGTWDLNLGTYEFQWVFTGAGAYAGCASPTVTVNVVTPGTGGTTTPSIATTTTVTAPSSAMAGQPISIASTVAAAAGNPAPAGGWVDMYFGNGTYLCTASLSTTNSSPSCTVTMQTWMQGSQTIYGCFRGYNGDQPSCSASVPITVSAPAPTPTPSPTPAPVVTPPPTPPPSPAGYSALHVSDGAEGFTAATAALGAVQAAAGGGVTIGITDNTGAYAPLVSNGLIDLGPSLDGSMPCPDFANGACPVAANFSPNPGFATVNTEDATGQNVFNGKWVEFTIAVPTTYNPGPDTGLNWYWSLSYTVAPNTPTLHDTLTIDVNPGTSPVHLLAPGT